MLILDPKLTHFSNFGEIKSFPCNTKTVTFTFSLMPLYQVQFQKNLISRFREKFKNVDLRSTNAPLTLF